MPDDLVRCGGAIGDKEQMVSIENAGCIALTLQDWSSVV